MAPNIFGWKPFSKKKKHTQAQPTHIPAPDATPLALAGQAPSTTPTQTATSLQAAGPSLTTAVPSKVTNHPESTSPPAAAIPPTSTKTPKVAVHQMPVGPPPTAYLPPKITDPQMNADPQQSVDSSEIENIREKCPQFRVLIIGRANSGKTTIIQRMCDTDEDPIVHDADGNEYPASVLNDPTAMRGIHDINLQITFKSNSNFVFHDSRGFEAGSVDEIVKVRDFIRRKLAERDLRSRLHAIWFCVPTDYTRVASEAELSFFKENTGDIPVILVFTKWDGQIIRSCNTLKHEHGMGIAQAMQEAPQHAKTVLEERYIPIFKNCPNPPATYAVLGYMNNPKAKCSELAEKTAAALNNGVLKKLFVSVQTHNLQLCIKGGIDEAVSKHIFSQNSKTKIDLAISSVLSWFPHMLWKNHDYSDVFDERLAEAMRGGLSHFGSGHLGDVMELFKPVASSSQAAFSALPLQKLDKAACAAIIATRSLHLKRRGEMSKGPVKASIEEYLASSQCGAVKTAITSKFHQYAVLSDSDLTEDTLKKISEELQQICMDNLLHPV